MKLLGLLSVLLIGCAQAQHPNIQTKTKTTTDCSLPIDSGELCVEVTQSLSPRHCGGYSYSIVPAFRGESSGLHAQMASFLSAPPPTTTRELKLYEARAKQLFQRYKARATDKQKRAYWLALSGQSATHLGNVMAAAYIPDGSSHDYCSSMQQAAADWHGLGQRLRADCLSATQSNDSCPSPLAPRRYESRGMNSPIVATAVSRVRDRAVQCRPSEARDQHYADVTILWQNQTPRAYVPSLRHSSYETCVSNIAAQELAKIDQPVTLRFPLPLLTSH